jgi:hypothetical protein
MAPKPSTAEWIKTRLEEMKAERLTGKFPEDRETILARLGYGDYESYLAGPLWQKIRRRVLKHDGSICARCGDRATQVHHLAYTEAVLKGEDDSQLVSVCKPCHEKVEFDDDRRGRRPEHDKRRVLEDREGARQEKIAAEHARLQLEERTSTVRDATGERCYWCKGNTEHPFWRNDGKVYTVPTADGQAVDAWMCSGCRRVLDHDREGRPRTDEQKLALLRKRPAVSYTRREPQVGLTITKAFRKLNAVQREGIINEFEWNAARIKDPNLEATDPERFAELKAPYESTKRNGRDRCKGMK